VRRDYPFIFLAGVEELIELSVQGLMEIEILLFQKFARFPIHIYSEIFKCRLKMEMCDHCLVYFFFLLLLLLLPVVGDIQ